MQPIFGKSAFFLAGLFFGRNENFARAPSLFSLFLLAPRRIIKSRSKQKHRRNKKLRSVQEHNKIAARTKSQEMIK
jgi:hypothetical protein